MLMAKEKFYRARNDKTFAGVFGGLGKYFDIDPTILRLLWVVVTIFSGILPGVLIYIIAIFLVPKEPLISRGIQATVIEIGSSSKNK